MEVVVNIVEVRVITEVQAVGLGPVVEFGYLEGSNPFWCKFGFMVSCWEVFCVEEDLVPDLVEGGVPSVFVGLDDL